MPVFVPFKKRYSLPELKKKIKEIEDYLGPRINYEFTWSASTHTAVRLLMEYNIILKERYYRRLKKRK